MLTNLTRPFSSVRNGIASFFGNDTNRLHSPDNRSPREEIAERAAESRGLMVAAEAVGLEAHRGMLHDTRQRANDGHEIGMTLLGFGRSKTDEPKEMGGITVTGDQVHHHQYSQRKSSWLPLLLGLVLGGAGIGGVAAGGLVGKLFPTQFPDPRMLPPAPVNPVEPDTFMEVVPLPGDNEWPN
jgi:hypothetical protein